MRTKILFIVIAFTSFCNAQIINIPDANFKAKLLEASPNNQIASSQTPIYSASMGDWYSQEYCTIDTNGDGEIQISEANSIKFLNIYASNLNSIVGILDFQNLEYLNCSSNQIANINLSGSNNLKFLICFNSQISNLNIELTPNLEILNCGFNLLSSLNVNTCPNLKSLNCQSNQIINLNFNTNLNFEDLYCPNNQMSTLYVNDCINLKKMDCMANQINSLQINNCVNLKELYCYNNLLQQLNTNNNINLEYIYCHNNLLTNLDFTQNINLKGIICENNLMQSIDASYCPNLLLLHCGFNQNLNYINVKNGNENFNFLFPSCNNLNYICADLGEISNIQTQINDNNMMNTCNVNSYCSFTPGGNFYTIYGNSKLDIDNNSCDSSDIIYPNLKYSITDGSVTGTFIANNSGSYSIPVQAGTQTVTPIVECPAYFNVAPTTFNVSFPTATNPYNQDFCITANGNHNDLEILLLPMNQARPGFDANYKLLYKNKGTTTQAGSINFAFDDSILDFVSSNPNISSQSTGNITWNFTNLLPFESREITIVLNLNSPIEIPALNIGDLLYYTASINGQTDETPNDNTAIINQSVVNSYDPNDKTCIEGETITPNMVGEYVHYLIRFENNGTANAQNIVVKDIIDTNKFDINTLIPIKGSHNFETRISSTNKVEFIFENINLPFEDANNDGYVSFKIKTKPNLVVGDTFSNLANIYFDYNFPIITNDYTTSVQNTLSLQETEFINDIATYPNPVIDCLNFKTKHNILKVEIYDIAGRILSSNSVFENKIDLSELKTGNYILKLYSEKGIMNTKIVKE